MVNVGQICMKIAGRDAGKLAVVVDVIDNNYVLIDGETRRRKCNVRHLEFLGKEIDVKKSSTSDNIKKALRDLGFTIKDIKKGKKREKKAKPKKLRKQKKEVSEKKDVKKK